MDGLKNIICMFMIVMTVTIWFKYDRNLGLRSNIKVEKVKIEEGFGVYWCHTDKCGEGDKGWNGYIPKQHYILIETPKSEDDRGDANKDGAKYDKFKDIQRNRYK